MLWLNQGWLNFSNGISHVPVPDSTNGMFAELPIKIHAILWSKEYRIPEWLGPRTLGVSLEPTPLSFFTQRYLNSPVLSPPPPPPRHRPWNQVDLWSLFATLDLLFWTLIISQKWARSSCIDFAPGREHRWRRPWSVSNGEWRSWRSQGAHR